MTTPGSVEFNQDISSGVINDIIERLANNNLDGFIIGSRDFISLQESLELSVGVVSDEGVQVLKGNGGVSELVLEDITSGMDEHDNGGIGSVGTNVFSESLVVTMSVIGLGDREENLALVVLGSLRESGFSSNGSFVVVGEKEDGGVALLEDLLDSLVTEGEDEREGVSINESLDGFIGDSANEVITEFVELLVEDDLRSFGLLEFSASDVSEDDIIEAHGDTGEGVPFIRLFFTVEDNDDLVLISESVKFFLGLNSVGDLTGSLLEPADDFIAGSTTVVFNVS